MRSPAGLLQPFADLIKMMLKEVLVPSNANRFLFLLAPVDEVIDGILGGRYPD